MTDIVVLLREGVFGGKITKTDAVLNGLMLEAAIEIEKLRADLKKATTEAIKSSWEGHVDRQGGSFDPHEHTGWR